jgi:hypothetical protein
VVDAGVETTVDAGVACSAPAQTVFLPLVTLSGDGNDYPTLHFQDPNGPEVTGYNIYRSADPSLAVSSWPQVGSDVSDEDLVTPDIQWTDTSGDMPPAGIWFYQIRAYNGSCGTESP